MVWRHSHGYSELFAGSLSTLPTRIVENPGCQGVASANFANQTCGLQSCRLIAINTQIGLLDCKARYFANVVSYRPHRIFQRAFLQRWASTLITGSITGAITLGNPTRPILPTRVSYSSDTRLRRVVPRATAECSIVGTNAISSLIKAVSRS